MFSIEIYLIQNETDTTMVVLSDRDIKLSLSNGEIIIRGVEPDHIGPSSVDLCLGHEFRVFRHAEVTHVDPKEGVGGGFMDTVTRHEKPFIIHPGEFVLATTKEYIGIPYHLVGRLDGRSSWGRLGIIVHSTAGFVNPGFEGQLTLEMTNISKVPVALWPGSRICQITFEKLSSPAEVPYDKRETSKYKMQTGPGATKISDEH